MSTLLQIKKDLQDIRDMVDDLCGQLDDLDRRGAMIGVEAGVAATSVSGAKVSHEFEREDVLPVGRLRHPPYQRLSYDEGRQHVISVLRGIGAVAWITPKFHAEQHYDRADARQYFYQLLARHCAELHGEGYAERRVTSKRGARYEYRLKERYQGDGAKDIK